MINKKCELCGKEFLVFKCRENTARFCSKSCHAVFHNQTNNPSWTRDVSGIKNPMYGKHILVGDKNPMYGKYAEQNPNWKGGRHARKDGYVRLTIKGKRVLEHRYVLGIDDPNVVVHHMNGKKGDNVVDNLLPTNRQEHARYHFSYHAKD